MRRLFFIALIGFIITGQCKAQEQPGQRILPGPHYTMLLLQSIAETSDKAGPPAFPKAGEHFDIFRADGDQGKEKKVGSVSFPGSAEGLKKRLGESLTADVLNRLQVKNLDEAYRLLLQKGPDTLGLTLLSPGLLEAFGMVYLDHDRNPAVTSLYRVDQVADEGAVIKSGTARIAGKLPVYPERYRVHSFLVTDSSAMVKWANPTDNGSGGMPLFANIYRRTTSRGSFEQVQKLFILSNTTSDSSYVSFSEQVEPGVQLSYYMQLEDLAGNLGPVSDTLSALAIDVSKLSSIQNLQVADSTTGLLLTWDPLPRQAIYTGIQILKSRQPGSDYVVVDTIPATDTAYLDEKVIAASSYYYKVRPLIYNLPGRDPLMFAEASGHKSEGENATRPVAPREVRVEATQGGVKINWQHGDELNLFGYFVLRGTSASNLEIVSRPVKDTVYIDSTFSPGFSGQLQYAVQVMNLSQAMSDTSEIASVTLRQPVVLSAPGGIQSKRTVDGVALQWEQTSDRDNNVQGYILYRRSSSDSSYKTLNKASLVRLPFYTDSTAFADSSYTYAVSSADTWGNQSILSPLTSIGPDDSANLPPASIYVRNLTEGIEISWPQDYGKTSRQYVVYRRQVGEKEFVSLGSGDATNTFIDKKSQKGTLYEYAVAVKTGITEGSKSAAQSIRRQ